MSQQNNRREFLKTTAATGVGYWVAGRAQADESQSKSGSPNEKINFACIGVDGKGDSDSNDAGRSGNVVAIEKGCEPCNFETRDQLVGKRARVPSRVGDEDL